jgi:hypothetical protein
VERRGRARAGGGGAEMGGGGDGRWFASREGESGRSEQATAAGGGRIRVSFFSSYIYMETGLSWS